MTLSPLTVDYSSNYEYEEEITSLITQELRTSLTPIRGTLGLLQSGKITSVSEDGQKLLEIALNNTHRLIRLISAIEQQVTVPMTVLTNSTIEKLNLETELREAWQHKQFFLVYQPIVCINSQKIIGVETLLRWQHPVRGLIPPTVFIPVAEESGLISELGTWIIEGACEQLARWNEQFPDSPPLMISVNLSAHQLLSTTLVEEVKNIIVKTGIVASRLKLEITETMLIGNYETANRTLQALQDIGIQIYIDDFGTGYSSLSRLQDLPVNALKLDRSFIKNKKWDISETIVHLAQKLGLEVIAEGVETWEDLQSLKAIGCQTAQGYYFSKPINAGQMDELLNQFVQQTDP